MKKIHLLSLLYLFLAVTSGAAEYRFQCVGETTGLCDCVYDEDGKETSIKMDFADPESAALFLALQKKHIRGTKGLEDHMGVKWEQKILLIGEFTSGIKATEDRPNTKGGVTAAIGPYRDFRVTGIKVAFPIWRFQEITLDDPSAGLVFMETHFSFDSLFPTGLKLKDKPIDFSKHVSAPKE